MRPCFKAGKPGLRRHADLSKLVAEVRHFSPRGAQQLEAAVPKIRTMYASLSGLPTPALRADWKVGVTRGGWGGGGRGRGRGETSIDINPFFVLCFNLA